MWNNLNNERVLDVQNIFEYDQIIGYQVTREYLLVFASWWNYFGDTATGETVA